VLLGYLAGNSYATIEKTFGRATALIVLAVAIAGVVVWRLRRRRTSRRTDHSDQHP
jgi:membrane protein DedA with SNARE-associated domain